MTNLGANTAALLLFIAAPVMASSLGISLDAAPSGQGKFAAEEIRREEVAQGMTLGEDGVGTRVVLTVDKDSKGTEQSYIIRVQNEGGRRIITVKGADAVGAMYGGLDIAEAIRTGTFDSLKDADQKPHVAKRGIKFNIPLDLHTPSYSNCSDAGQANIPEVWERDFWMDFLNSMARNRYNVLSLWSLHPFPSLVKVPEFASLDALREPSKEDVELRKTIFDCEALAWLGRYYAAKIRGACALALFDTNSSQMEHEAATRHLGDALAHWKQYAAIRDTHYVPALSNRVGHVNVTTLIGTVAADIDIARNWKPGTLKDDGNRGDSEKGFRN